MLEEENEALEKKNKHFFGSNRLLQDQSSSLQSQLGEAQKRTEKSHLSQEELNGKVVRQKKLLRSKDFEIMDLRSKLKSRRRK